MDPNPYESPTSAQRHGLLARINETLGFGFGLIDKWVFLYAGGVGLCAVGAGMVINDICRTGHLQFNGLNVVAFSALLSGLVLANIAHSVLKKQASASKTGVREVEPELHEPSDR